jgi:hypothetical protein
MIEAIAAEVLDHFETLRAPVQVVFQHRVLFLLYLLLNSYFAWFPLIFVQVVFRRVVAFDWSSFVAVDFSFRTVCSKDLLLVCL